MPHIEAIEKEIARLDSLASDIDSEVSKLANEMETERQLRKGPYIGRDASMYNVYVFKPNTSQQARKRKLAADYESWYNAANELINAYLPKRVNDFESYYKYKKYTGHGGLFFDIQFNQNYEHPDSKTQAARSIQHQLDCQRNILNSIPGAIKARGMDLLVVISHDLVKSEIDLADHIFKKDKTHEYCLRVAGILAGIALERHLKTRCESETGSLPGSPTLSPLIDALYKANKITLNQKKYLEAIATTRNDCAHATASVDRTMVGEAISNVKKHLEGNL
jgi:hypothetical protein